jgi:hypothetical protein
MASHTGIALRGRILTAGTASLSACDDAASVVTDLKAGRATGAKALRLSGDAMLLLMVLENIVTNFRRKGGDRRGVEDKADGE